MIFGICRICGFDRPFSQKVTQSMDTLISLATASWVRFNASLFFLMCSPTGEDLSNLITFNGLSLTMGRFQKGNAWMSLRVL